MEFTVYRQASKVRPDGTVVYKGEDAMPYAGRSALIIADGLGGAAAIRHTSIKPELFDENTLPDTLFKDVWKDWSAPSFSEYVKGSFFELYSVKNCYTDNVNNIKKSGYFASRIVAAIVLHELMYNKAVTPDAFFAALDKETDEDKKAAALDKLGVFFKEKIAADLRKIAKNGNIVYESSYSGLALLGTTLCTAIFRENKDDVDVIYLTAGDSRPYYWSPEDGLCQLIADEERADGGMTNYIKANDDTEFDIRCTYKKLKKPCMIFNATDGCFDSGKFNSPLAFEHTILTAAASSESTVGLSSRLTEFFSEYGRHDDSSTMAGKMLGFADYASFKKAAADRLEVIEKEYLADIPELLDMDYAAEAAEAKKAEDNLPVYIAKRMSGSDAVDKLYREEVSEDAVKAAGESEAVKAAAAEYERIVREEEEKFVKAAIEKKWAEKSVEIVNSILDGSDEQPEFLADAVKQTGDDMAEEYLRFADLAEKQGKLFAGYEEKYSRYMGGND